MSDINISGIPYMGFQGGGGGVFGGDAATGQSAWSADQINASMGLPGVTTQNQGVLNNNFSNFGQQTDYYSGLGAAYGRQTGGFGAVPVGGGQSPFAEPGSYYDDSAGMPSGGGGVSTYRDPFTGAESAMGSVFDQGGYAQMYRMPDANPDYFNPGTYAGDQGNYGIPYQGAPLPGDIGYSRQNPMPNIGYNPGMENAFANPGMGGGGFAGRFGQWGANPGTPSQYYTGQNYGGPSQMPPGYSPLYDADNPGGALPLGANQDPDLFKITPGGG